MQYVYRTGYITCKPHYRVIWICIREHQLILLIEAHIFYVLFGRCWYQCCWLRYDHFQLFSMVLCFVSIYFCLLVHIIISFSITFIHAREYGGHGIGGSLKSFTRMCESTKLQSVLSMLFVSDKDAEWNFSRQHGHPSGLWQNENPFDAERDYIKAKLKHIYHRGIPSFIW